MKTIQTLALAFSAMALISCSSTTTRNLRASSTVPAAEGEVTVNPSSNNNFAVDVEVKHLAPPQKVSANASTYVVWLEPTFGDNRTPQNAGALLVDKDLTGKFSTVIPHKNFVLFVTPEDSRLVSKPSGERVLETTIMRTAE